MHGTTIVAVHKDGVTAIAGDGQVTMGETIVKRGAVKVRPLADGAVLAGFAGTVSDAFTLLEKFEGYLESAKGNLVRAAVETVKEWRTDRALRNLEALLIVADSEQILTLSGVGDVQRHRSHGRRRRARGGRGRLGHDRSGGARRRRVRRRVRLRRRRPSGAARTPPRVMGSRPTAWRTTRWRAPPTSTPRLPRTAP